jgi:hypothetical protein
MAQSLSNLLLSGQGFRMKQRRLVLVFTALVGVAWLTACGKSAPPVPNGEPSHAATPVVNTELRRLAAEVYVYAYPIVLTDVTRDVDTKGIPPNVFRHEGRLPDASSTDVASPNADFLYSHAWLDLSKGPVMLSVPDTRGRYYLVAVLGAWTNVVASLGSRTTGTKKAEFAIVGPNWRDKLPGGVFEVHSPTELAWLFARMQTSGGMDREAAARIQNEFKLTNLAGHDNRARKAPAYPARSAGIDVDIAAREQVSQMDAATFFTRFAMLLTDNPPLKDDVPMLKKMKMLGIEANHPFDVGKLDPDSVRSIDEGAKSAFDAISSDEKSGTGGDIRNGWTFDVALGRWGTDYGKRAVTAYIGLGFNAPEDAIFMATHLDAGGHQLEGANQYLLHFDSGNSPPADGFWSLSLYDDEQHFVANALNRYSLGSNSRLKSNADGSLDIYIQNVDPGSDKESNWLPAPKDNFNLILRIYWPKPNVVDGKWTAPGIRNVR